MAPVELPDVPVEAMGQDAWATLSNENLLGKSSSTLGVTLSSSPPRRPPLPSSSIPLQRVITPTDDSGTSSSSGDVWSRAASEKDVEESPVSLRGSTHGSSSEADKYSLWGGYESPMPREPAVAARRDERRYRLLLQHDFHPTREFSPRV